MTLLDLQKAVLQDQGNEITKIKFNGSSPTKRWKGKKIACKQYETQQEGFVTALRRNCRMKRMTKGNHQELIFTLPWCLTKLPLALIFTKQTNISLEKVKLSIFPLNKIKTPYVHRPFSFPALLSRMKKPSFS